MGEVYRAKDTKLGREVAMNALPHTFACDPDRLARFRREAQLLASLSHPNIAAIYGLDESAASLFLVMELVPGQTLSEQVKAGPLEVEEPGPLLRRWRRPWLRLSPRILSGGGRCRGPFS